MPANKINIDKLSETVLKELDAFRDVTVDIMEYAVKRTAKETVTDIRDNIQSAGIHGTGAYAKSWAYKRDDSLRGSWKYSMVVFSRKPHYSLAHLLEKGHAKLSGGRVAARPHIKPAEEIARENLLFYIKSGIEQGKAAKK